MFVAEKFWFVGGGRWILLFQTGFSTKKELWSTERETYFKIIFFFKTKNISRKCQFCLKMQFLSRKREIQWRIQLSPFALDPSCEMLTVYAYPMGLIHLFPCSSSSAPGISYWLYQCEGLETPQIRKPNWTLQL